MIFRTDDQTKWGLGKGANLTALEIDGNFWELLSRIQAVEDNPALPPAISNIQVVGTQMTIFLDNGVIFGPYTLPSAMIHYRGDWLPGTVYFELDLVLVPGKGVYLVLRDHTSATTFDPAAIDALGRPVYRWLLPTATADYDVGFFHPGRIGYSAEIMFQFIVPRTFTLPRALVGSYFRLRIAPTAIMDLDVLQNGSLIGTIRFNPAVNSGTVPESITWPGNEDVRFLAGDLLQVREPATEDATAAGLTATFAGIKV